ncbi:hypothetical protein PVW48_02270 [Dinoroseobacter sp. PD6]|uniref:hypothetical protein n=1 Tax=Dinoroseobacter sp. PD6 TaxID=3028384 RepID=UPI00237BE781|nr:hypothetical protein [Dinoroseobacter sp. PD6]MDD9715555.1 hypothetical protein [Dinoroseobacter sp. PD6]
MRSNPGIALFVGLALAGTPALAQEPMSAIDWLSDVIEALPPPEIRQNSDVAPTAGVEQIEVAPLEDLAIDGVGILPQSVSGLPSDFWGITPAADLATLLRVQSTALPLPARRLLKRILLAELDPPVDTGPDHTLFLARLDTLLAFGALPDAQALIERGGLSDDPQIFRRWFDISLLRGDEARACATLRAVPDIAPTFSARIFCLARNNDWPAAALSLETARALGFVSEAEDLLMARFLDPEIFEGMPMAAPPNPLTPLDYRMLAALGEAPPARSLPLAFNHALLAPTQGWKPRLEAAERLARTGGITHGQLFALYTERNPAASGGLWDRVAAVQAFDLALLAGDAQAVADTLPKAVQEMAQVGLTEVFAAYYGSRLTRLPTPDATLDLVLSLVLLTPEAEGYADKIRDPLLAAIARGRAPEALPSEALPAAMASAFAEPAPDLPPMFARLLAGGQYGEATLRALGFLGQETPDPDDASTAVQVLRALGFEQTARDIALNLLLRDRVG